MCWQAGIDNNYYMSIGIVKDPTAHIISSFFFFFF